MYSMLIVDDEKSARDRFYSLLSQSEDWSILAMLKDGGTALEVIEEYRPDIILIDIVLPTMGGEEVIRRTRAINDYHPLIYAISDLGVQELKRELTALGVNRVSMKSISDEELLYNVFALIGKEYNDPRASLTTEEWVRELIYRMDVPLYFLYSLYMVDAILMQLEAGDEFRLTKTALIEIAKKHRVSKQAVDGGLRFFIKKAQKAHSEMFVRVFGALNRKITTTEFIVEASNYLQQNMIRQTVNDR